MSVLTASPVSPYKGLAPFEDSELDALFFFGRERETEVIVANLLAAKLTVLYGPSGVGKSSILRAAVTRRLREAAPGAEVTLLHEWTGEPVLPEPVGETYYILDQFEEYFLYHDDGPLLDALPELLASPRVHLLISLREDALAQLDAFQSRIPNVLGNRLRLDHLDESAARAAVVGPLDRWNEVAPEQRMGVETALIDAVLLQVAAAPDADGVASRRRLVEAPYLQLVLERVWDEERAAGSQVLRLGTLERLGGARAIVSAHLERALGSLGVREAAIATSALKFLVTPSRTKIAHSFSDLVGYTDESPVELQTVLERLASQRILRAVAAEGDGEGRYEIFHDVLAEPVLAWRREFEARAALDRERERSRRRNRRLTRLVIGAALLSAALVALAAWALTQQHEASKQRLVAQQQAANAKQQQHVAQAQKLRADRQKQVAVARQRAELRAEKAAAASAKQAQASAAQATKSKVFAQHEQRVAEQQAVRAHNAAAASKRSAREAKQQSLAAKRQARRATAGELVATSTAKLGVDPIQSVRAAVAAAALEASNRVEDALRSSLVSLRTRAVFDGGGGPVNATAFSPDGSLVATGAGSGAVRLFRTTTHAVVHSLDAGSAVTTVVFSPDGRTLLAGTTGGRALLWNVGSGTLVHTLVHGGSVLTATFAGGGAYVVTGSADRTLRVWDASSGTPLATATGERAVTVVAASPTANLVVAVSQGDPVARVYSLPDGALVQSLPQQAEVTDAGFAPGGDLLVTTGRRNGYVWSTKTWTLEHLLVGHSAALTDLAFTNDGRVVTSSIDSSARVWDLQTGDSLFTLVSQHQQKVLAVAVSPDGTEVATASADQTARIWDSPLGETPYLLAGHTDSVGSVSFSPDGRLVLTGSSDHTARLWDPRGAALSTLGAQGGAVTSVDTGPGGLVVSAGADGTARIWRGTTVLQTLTHAARVTKAAFVDGGREVLTASEDGTAKLWRVADGALLATFAHGAPVRGAVWSPAFVVTGGDDGGVRAWTPAGKLMWQAQQGSPVTTVALSASGVVATGGADGTVRLWRGRDGGRRLTLRGHTGAVTSLAFDPHGTTLASASADTTARLWSTATGAPLHTLARDTLGLTSVAFSPDGTQVLTASVDGDARLWSAATGRSLHRLSFHVSTVSQASFSPDGRWVVTAGPSTAGIWQVRTGDRLYGLGGVTGQLTGAVFASDSRRIVVGTSGGSVGTFFCAVCARTPALLAQANAALRSLRTAG